MFKLNLCIDTPSLDSQTKRSSTKNPFKRTGIPSATPSRPESPVKKYLQPTLSDPHPTNNKKPTTTIRMKE
ncbi:unnamed protein product [Leptidea sinapis]|uniref:Uncharacterized protein n=1 Tax=Leptidea sinapis TaxID=189913 RepID=A0A5E4QJU2_9NEOP|nr:unnamed protein product [Leptidea sinapis]